MKRTNNTRAFVLAGIASALAIAGASWAFVATSAQDGERVQQEAAYDAGIFGRALFATQARNEAEIVHFNDADEQQNEENTNEDSLLDVVSLVDDQNEVGTNDITNEPNESLTSDEASEENTVQSDEPQSSEPAATDSVVLPEQPADEQAAAAAKEQEIADAQAAQEAEATQAIEADEPANPATDETATDAAQTSEAEAGESATEPEPAPLTGTIEQTLALNDGSTLTVRAAIDEAAGVPANAELVVSPLPSIDAAIANVLDLGADDQLRWGTLISVQLVADGEVITPAAPIAIELEATAVPAPESDALEVALLNAATTRPELTNATATAAHEQSADPDALPTRVQFQTDALGTIALGEVTTQQFAWQMHGGEVRVYGPRQATVQPRTAGTDEELVEGVRVSELFTAATDSTHAFATRLWIACDEPTQTEPSVQPGIIGCVVRAGRVPKVLFGLDGTPADPVPFDASDYVALLWDSGYREETLDLGGLTLEGLLPKGTSVTATDATATTDALALAEGVDTADVNKYDYATVAAWELSFEVDGASWTPNDDHALAMSVDAAPATDGAELEVWKVENNAAQQLGDATSDGGQVRLTATEDGTYAVVERTVLHRELTASDGNTYDVQVSYDGTAGLPRDTELRVSEVEGTALIPYRVRSREALGGGRMAYLRAFDITLVGPDGAEVEPAEPLQVSIRLADGDAPEGASVLHFADGALAADAPEVLAATAAPEDGACAYAFEATGFSVYAVAYTVDFHWGEYTYNLEGGSTIFLSELLETLINGASEGGNKASEATEGADGSVEVGTSAEETENRSLTNGSAGVYDTTQLQKVLEHPELVEKVEFSDPELMEVIQSYIVEEDTAAEQDEEDDEALAGTEGEAKTDWALVSKNPFDTAETLTITLTDGSRIEIPTTDERVAGAAASGGRLTVDGVTYTLVSGTGDGTSTTSNEDRNGDGVADGDSYYGRATVYALSSGCTIHNEITDSSGHIYKVWNLRMTGAALQGTTNKMDRELVNRAAGYKFSLPRVRTSIADIQSDPNVTQAELDSLPTSDFKAGDKNTSSGNQVWKKASYNPATNSIDYEIKTFQAMKQDVPLDFIFIYDDSVTMYTGDRGAPRNNGNDNRNETVIREAQATRILILSAAQALTSKTRTDGYNIRVAMGGASNNDNRISDWYSAEGNLNGGYSGIENYLATYKTGATTHVVGLNNAMTLARKSVAENRQPIVIYLSDFKDGAINNTTATQLHNIARVYTLQTADRTTPYPRASTITSDVNSTFFNMSQIDDGVQKMENIILDAIGYYMKDKVTITDNLSDPLKSMTTQPTSGTTESDTGTTTDAVGKNTWEIGGTKDSSGKYPGAGTVYTETFSVKLNDNKVYTGDIPTNGKATVYVGGKEENVITPDEDNPDELHAAKDVTLLLGKLDDHDEYTNQVDSYGAPTSDNLLSGISFTLQEATKSGNTYTAKSGATTYTYTTSSGAFTVPYKDGNNIILQRGHYYLLTEDSDTVDTYNSAENRDPLLKVPDKSWVITVADNGEISVAPQSGAGQTPEATIAKADGTNPARIVLWNMIQVPATLIPITVQKVWPDSDHPHDPVPFTIYGVEPDSSKAYKQYKLTAYDGTNAATATQVRYLDSNSDDCTVSADGKTWTQTVYVLDKIDDNGTEVQFYDAKTLEISALEASGYTWKVNNTNVDLDTYDALDGVTDGKITYDQTYSYRISEGELVYDYGWYTPDYTNNANSGSRTNTIDTALASTTLQAFDQGTGSVPHTNESVTGTSSNYQMHFNIKHFRYKDGNYSSTDFNNYFGSSDYYYNSLSEKRSFFNKVGTIEVEFIKSGKTYSLSFTPDHSSYNNINSVDDSDHTGFVFKNISLPSDWSSSYTSYSGNLNTAYVLNGITISKITVTSSIDSTKSMIMYGGGTNNEWEFAPSTTPILYSTMFEVKSTGHDYNHGYSTGISSQSLTVSWTEPGSNPTEHTSDSKTISINNPTVLGITNAWSDNPLAEINVKKEWKVDEDADSSTLATDYTTDTYNAKQDVTFSLKGTNESGVEKPVSIFTPASNSDTDVAAMKSAWNTNGTGGASTGTISKTDVNKDLASWEQTFYVPTYDMSTYKRTVNDDGTETVIGPEQYSYNGNSLFEHDMSVNKDDDNQVKGDWGGAPVVNYDAGDTVPVSDYIPYDASKYDYYRLAFRGTGKKSGSVSASKIEFSIRYRESTSGSWKTAVLQLSFNDPIPISYSKNTITNFNNIRVPKSWIGFDKISSGSSAGKPIFEVDNLFINDINYASEFTSEKPASGFLTNYSWDSVQAYGNTINGTGINSTAVNDTQQNISYTDENGNPVTVGQSTSMEPEAAVFTLTNTYTPYKEVKLSSAFNDGSDDRSSTAQVKKVIYTIKDSNGDVVRTTDMAMENGSGDTVRQSYFQPDSEDSSTKRNYKSIYLPKGNYTISQSYTLDDGESAKQYALDDSLDAYSVRYTEKIGTTTTGPTDGVSYDATINSDRELSFTNTRKTMPIRVIMDWEPGLTENEDPLKSTSKMIPYKISYDTADTSADTTDKVKGNYTKTYKTSNNGTETSQNLTDTDFSLEYARQTNDHAAGIPTYSVREMITQCDFSYKDGEGPEAVEKNYLEEILPDYDCNVKQEEIDTDNNGVKDTMVFTIEAHIKRAAVIIEKNFDEAFDYDDYKGAELTYTLKRSDGKVIYGTDTDSVELTMTVPEQFDLDNDGNKETDLTNTSLSSLSAEDQTAVKNILNSMLTGTILLHDENTAAYDSGLDARTKEVYTNDGVLDTINLPILRATDVDGGQRVKYVVSEAVVKDGTPQSYFPSFTDQTNNADNKFEQTNPAGKNEDTTQFGKANTAKFILNAAGIIIGIGNAETPYICKIVETFGTGENKSEVENPFRLLTDAVKFARENGNGQDMGTDNPVKIEMLVDYVIPSTDKVTLDKTTDNIIITTAATSGGVYNFTDTLEGKADSDKGTAILTRGFSSTELFAISNASAKFSTTNIIFDGDREGTITGTAQTGRAIKASNAGAGVTIRDGSVFRNFYCSSTSSGASYGSVIYTEGNLTLLNEESNGIIRFDNNETVSYGGSVYVKKIVTVSGGTDSEGNESGNPGTVWFSNSKSKDDGGAIFCYGFRMDKNSGTLKFTDCATVGNGDYEGGAIQVQDNDFLIENNTGLVHFENCYTDQTSGDGGAISVFNSEKLTIECTGEGSTKFINCAAAKTSGSATGGALYTYNDSLNVITVTAENGSVVFENCSSGGNGGAICQSSGLKVEIKNAQFKNCSSGGDGGGVYAAQDMIATGEVSFDGCTSSKSGGAVYTKGVFVQNQRVLQSAKLQETGSQTDSGLGWKCDDAYFVDTEGKMATINSRGYYKLNNSPSVGFIRKTPGGYWQPAFISTDPLAVRYQADSGGPWSYTGTFEYGGMTWFYFQGNHGFSGTPSIVSDLPQHDFSTGDGNVETEGIVVLQAAHIQSGTVSDTKAASLSITDCQANNGNGGGVYAGGSAYLLADVDLENCAAVGSGGGFFANNALTFSSDSDIAAKNCNANNGDGGAIYKSGTGVFTVRSGSAIDMDNCTSSRNGGGMYVGSAFENIESGISITATECAAAGNGGGIYANLKMELSGTIRMDTCTATNGGGVYANSDFSIAGNWVFDGCEATTSGGAIYVKGRFTENQKASIPKPEQTGAQTDSGLGWKCDSSYFVNAKGKFATIDTRNYLKQNSIPAIGFIRKTPGGYWQPALISTEPLAVSYKQGSNGPWDYSGTFEYGGLTWFYFQGGNGLPGTPTLDPALPRHDFTGGDGKVSTEGAAVLEAASVQSVSSSNSPTSLTITDCSATNNDGGGIYVTGVSDLVGDIAVKRCSAGANGGGTYFGGNVIQAAEAELSIDSCHAKANGGGAFFYSTSNLNGEIKFNGCYGNGTISHGGGAYFRGVTTINSGSNSESNTTFDSCYTTTNGGGAYFEAAESDANITGNLIFKQCYSTDGKGGGAYFNSTANLTGAEAVTFKGCHADSTNTSNGGGGAWFNSTATLDEATGFEDCYTGAYGGGIYFNGTGTITDVSVNGHTTGNTTSLASAKANAAKGGAIYIANSKTLTIIGGKIKNCSASDETSGGAVNAGGTSAVLNFQGAVKIYDNKSKKDGSEVLANVVLDIDDNDLIKTSATGLTSDAHIGIYVVDAQEDAHGGINDPFGTWTATDGKNNLDRFTNDRNDKLFGMKHGDSDKKIYWGAIICKIEDSNAAGGDKLDGRDVYEHPFPSINAAVDYARANLSGKATIEMLIDYEFPAFDVVNLTAATDDITITTAKTSGCVYNFDAAAGNNPGRVTGDDADRAILLRAWNGAANADQSLFYVYNDAAKLTTTNIIFDGSQTVNTTFTGRAVYVNAGEATIKGGSTLRNFYTNDSGGAVYSKGNITIVNDVTEKTITFDNNKAKSGACVYSSANITLTNKFASDAIQFLNSYATSCNNQCGGATASKSLTINGGTKESGEEQGNQGNILVQNCYADDDGGAIAVYNGQFIVENNEGSIQIKDCWTTGSGDEGGAIYLYGSTTGMTITNTGNGTVSFENCSSGGMGGAICSYSSGGTTITMTGTAANPITFKNCTSSKNGGAICQETGKSVELNNVYFEDCRTSGANGGAMYLVNGGTLENVSVNGHKNLAAGTANAQLGGAVYGNGNLIIKQSGSGKSEITNCSASTENNGGAVNVASGKTMTFEGDVVIFNNLSTKNGSQVQANVVLDQNNNTTINTSPAGLGSSAHIGVYVTGNNTTPLTNHGQFEQDFGTIGTKTEGNVTTIGDQNLDAFTNDRNGLYGEACSIATHNHDSNKIIHWVSYLCKLTDADGNLLYKDAAHTDAAVYKFLKTQTGDTNGKKTGGFDAAQGTLYTASGTEFSGTAVQVQMLRNYTQPSTDQPTLSGSRAVTFTTANKTATDNPGYSAGDIYIYNRGSDTANTEADRATIWRASDATTGSILTVGTGTADSDTAGTLTITKLILDGNLVQTNANGGIVNAHKGTLNVNAETIMRKSIAANGGAVYLGAGSIVAIGGTTDTTRVLFEDCRATENGGVIYDGHTGNTDIDTVKLQYVTIDGHAGSLADTIPNAKLGGAIYIKKSIDLRIGGSARLKDCTILDCSASEQGGAVFSESLRRFPAQDENSGDEPTIHMLHTIIDGHDTLPITVKNALRGGAILLANGTLELESDEFGNSEIRNCTAETGGAIESYGGGTQYKGTSLAGQPGDYTVKIKNTKITNCTAAKEGGAIKIKAILTMIGAEITGCSGENGGAVYMRPEDGSIFNMSSGTIRGNNATSGNGGAVYMDANVNTNANAKAVMNLTGGTISGNTVPSGKNGAGIYLVEGSKLNISGSPSFGGTDSTGGNHIGTGTNAKREDIYIAGYLGLNGEDPKLAESLVVTGKLYDSLTTEQAKGQIWVGAQQQGNEDNNHWDTLKQFAKFDNSLMTTDSSDNTIIDSSKLDSTDVEKIYAAFRNATLTDETYGMTGDGQTGGIQCIYWEGVQGSRKVILRKVSTTYESLSGAKFTITKGSKEIEGVDINGTTTKTFTSGDSGVFYIGMMDYGVYVLHETEHPANYTGGPYYYLIVDEDGVLMSTPDDGYSSASDAKTAGDAKFKERQTARKNTAQQSTQNSGQTTNP